jgi:hypothetical protein
MADEDAALDLESMVAADNAADDTPAPDESDDGSTDTGETTDVGDGEPEESVADSTEDAADSGSDDDAAAPTVFDRAREALGEKGWLSKYKTEEAFFKAMDEAQSRLGQRDENAQFVQALVDAGVTQDDIQTLFKQKTEGTPAPTTSGPEWNPNWVAGFDKDNKPIPSADAPTDFDAKFARHSRKVTELLLRTDPQKLEKALAGEGQTDPSAIAAVRQEMAAANQERLRNEWINSHKDQLFVNGDRNSMTPLGQAVDKLVTGDEINPTWPWEKRAEAALARAGKELGVKPTTPTTPKKAKRQVTPAATPKKTISDDEHFEKEGDGLMEFLKFAQPEEVAS